MKTYKIPCVWQMWGCYKIKAKNLQEAEKKALEELPLPDGDYIDDSIELDRASSFYGETVEVIEGGARKAVKNKNAEN